MPAQSKPRIQPASAHPSSEIAEEKVALITEEPQLRHTKNPPRARRATKFAAAVALILASILIFTFGGIVGNAVVSGLSHPPPKHHHCHKHPHHRDIVAKYLEPLESDNLAPHWLAKYTSEPHLAGTAPQLVNWTAQKFTEFGLKGTHVSSYPVLLNYPEDHGLKLLDHKGKVSYEPTLREDELSEDPTTQRNDSIPVFHGYSASGNVTGRFLYANYGRKSDFEALEAAGVNMTGTIAVVRYGAIFRGLKVKFAQEHGCAAVLMYSDPKDDGEMVETNGYKPYPDGPARNPSSVQRGSVQFISVIPGDPTTPGWPSKEGCKRVDPHHSIPTIPSLPISPREVQPILEALKGCGPNATKFGDDWIGSLPGFDYSVGPSHVEMNLYNKQKYEVTPVNNVIGRIPGRIPGEAIIVGNHRDAWVLGGAGDPNSGTAVMLEVIRAFSALQQTGWRPLRTIIFASWDGEEYGLLGSTEWGEDNAEFLQENVVGYINLDVAVSGSHLTSDASPVFNDLLRSVTKHVEDPQTPGKSVFDTWNAANGAKIGNLGSGSDYTVFLEHLGISSIDLGFAGAATDAIYHYHSNYDSFHWMETYGDPGFKYHNTMAKIVGVMTLELASQPVLPLTTVPYATAISEYFAGLKKQFKGLQCPAAAPLVQQVEEAIAEFAVKTLEFDAAKEQLVKEWKSLKWYQKFKRMFLLHKIHSVNQKLKSLERQFLYEPGLTRSWFKHIVYAAGRYTGYAGTVLPGLTEALEDGDAAGAALWLQVIAEGVKKAGDLLD